ncbi:hypothetical protein [Nocardia sp. CA-290969]|uniref:hypothetical protein n=1 Tax=Nocardia sp. CA-290969 TaxID=3239986 RepID=UPI003D8D9CCD
MTRAEREFYRYLLALVVGVTAVLIWLTYVHPSPVSSPGDGRVPAVTGTAGTSTTQ